MTAIIDLITGGNGTLAIIGAAAFAVIAAFFRGRVTGARAERDHQRAKEADAYEQHLEDIAAARTARNNAPVGGVPDDPYRRD